MNPEISRNSARPILEEIKALDGRIYAMLSDKEKSALFFVMGQGRKLDVAVALINDADAQTLRSLSEADAEQLLMSSNSTISITIGSRAEAAFARMSA
jgi:hypothetical protein